MEGAVEVRAAQIGPRLETLQSQVLAVVVLAVVVVVTTRREKSGEEVVVAVERFLTLLYG